MPAALSPQAQELMVCRNRITYVISLPHHEQIDLDAIYQTIEYGGDEGAARAKAISVLADWTRGTYGLGPDTDMFIICPRRTDGTVVLEGNDTHLVDFLTEPGRSQGVMVLMATLDYARKGLPINLEAFTPPWVVIQPLGERAIQVFDKDTMYRQSCTLMNIRDRNGQHICTVSSTNKGIVLPADAFTSRPPDHVFFNQKFIVSVFVCWLNVGAATHSSKSG